MAVWLIVWGNNKLGNFEKTDSFLREKKIHIPLDLTFLSKVESNFLHEKVELDSVYDDNLWDLAISNDTIHLTYQLSNHAESMYKDNDVWKFSICLQNDIISFKGPFRHFSDWSYIFSNDSLREGWAKVIQTIYKLFV